MTGDWDEHVAVFRYKITEEIRLHGSTKWRTADQEQEWSGLGINTHAATCHKWRNDPEIEQESDTTQWPALHRWKPRERKRG